MPGEMSREALDQILTGLEGGSPVRVEQVKYRPSKQAVHLDVRVPAGAPEKDLARFAGRVAHQSGLSVQVHPRYVSPGLADEFVERVLGAVPRRDDITRIQAVDGRIEVYSVNPGSLGGKNARGLERLCREASKALRVVPDQHRSIRKELRHAPQPAPDARSALEQLRRRVQWDEEAEITYTFRDGILALSMPYQAERAGFIAALRREIAASPGLGLRLDCLVPKSEMDPYVKEAAAAFQPSIIKMDEGARQVELHVANADLRTMRPLAAAIEAHTGWKVVPKSAYTQTFVDHLVAEAWPTSGLPWIPRARLRHHDILLTYAGEAPTELAFMAAALQEATGLEVRLKEDRGSVVSDGYRAIKTAARLEAAGHPVEVVPAKHDERIVLKFKNADARSLVDLAGRVCSATGWEVELKGEYTSAFLEKYVDAFWAESTLPCRPKVLTGGNRIRLAYPESVPPSLDVLAQELAGVTGKRVDTVVAPDRLNCQAFRLSPALQQAIEATVPKGVYLRKIYYLPMEKQAILKVRVPPALADAAEAWRTGLECRYGLKVELSTVWATDKLAADAQGHGLLTEAAKVWAVLRESRAAPIAAIRAVTQEGRLDLTGLDCFTIDSAASRILDDALSFEVLGGGRARWGIHIADVGALLERGSQSEAYARRNARTAYGWQSVAEMLPANISLVASLLPSALRPAWSLLVDLSSEGGVEGYELRQSMIQSRAKLSYKDARQALADDAHALHAPLAHMTDMALELRMRRLDRGSINIEGEGLGHVVVEEAMLLANRLVAERLVGSGLPSLYRVHAVDDLAALSRLLEELGAPTAPEISAIRAQLKTLGGLDKKNVNAWLAEALGPAHYDVKNRGHFALNFPAYTHFTSPIRRYADIVVQRQLEAAGSGPAPYTREQLVEICRHANDKRGFSQRRTQFLAFLGMAANAARRAGSLYDGCVENVTPFGLLVSASVGMDSRHVALAKVSALKGIIPWDGDEPLGSYKAGEYVPLRLEGFDTYFALPRFSIDTD